MKVMEEVHLTTIKPKNDVLLLAQEISFAKVLACNDKRLRDRGLKRLRKWFMARSQGSIDFTQDDHMRIWKGLFYCMWMSDKPLVQEELAEEISNLVHSFASFKSSLLFVETFFTSLSVEWFGIDQLRLDKFMMLMRRFMRQSFELVARIGWPEEQVQQLADVYYRTLNTAPLGLNMHIIEIFCEELAKVGKGKLSSLTILQFITVFARFLATLKDGRLISQITRYVFLHLIRQTEVGVEYQMKFAAWKEYGFPGGNIDTAEKVEVESEDEEMMEGSEDEMVEERQVGVDARAGFVDVLLPPLDFDISELLEVLKELRNKKETTTKARKTFIRLISKYEDLSAGKYPLGLHKVELPQKTNKKKELMRAAKQLYIEERKLIHGGSESEEDVKVKVSSSMKIKRRKVKKTNKSVWEVSEANSSEERLELEPTNSWEVSESNTKSELKVKHSKKRKSDQEVSLTNSIVKSPKKVKITQFSGSCSKENSFSSPVASTPKNKGTKNVLKKASDLQNISTEGNSAILNSNNCVNNNGWGGEWNEPIKDNEIEYEIFIPNKKYVEKRKSLGLSYPVSSFVQKSAEKVTPINRLKAKLKHSTVTPNSQKKVEFNLSANCSQDYKEYTQQIKSNKHQVPFDALKRPVQGLLKTSTPSPINPFYKGKLNFLKSPEA